MDKSKVLDIINSSPEIAKDALNTLYRGKAYIVENGSGIQKFAKTRRGADGYIKRLSQKSYYDDNLQRNVIAGDGLSVVEILDDEILDPSFNKRIWYLHLKKVNGKSYLYNTVMEMAKKMIKEDSLLEYVIKSLEEVKNNQGLVYIEEFEKKQSREEFKKVPEDLGKVENEVEGLNIFKYIKIEEGTHTKTEEKLFIVKLNNKVEYDVFKSFEIEIKSIGGYYSGFVKGFIFKEEPGEKLLSIDISMLSSNNASLEPANYPRMDIDDIESYTVSKELSKRENDGHWILRTKERDHQKEIQKYLEGCNNEVLKILSNTNNKRIEYELKKELQKFKKAYYKNYIARLTNKANNPSWMVTGRSGRNMSKHKKLCNRYDDFMREAIELEKRWNEVLNKFKNKITNEVNKEKQKIINEKLKNTDIEIKFKIVRKKIYHWGSNTRFYEVRCYMHNNYEIAKHDGCFRIYSNNNEIHTMKTRETLEDAKRYVKMLVVDETNNIAEEAM